MCRKRQSRVRFKVPLTGRILRGMGLLRLILYWVRQRAFVLDYPYEVSAIDPAAAGFATNEVLGLVFGRIANSPSHVLASGNVGHVFFWNRLAGRTRASHSANMAD